MTTSPQGIEFIKQHEGLRLTAYNCAAGHATIGYGHDTTNDAQPAIVGKTTITLEQAEDLLRKDLVKYENAVNAGVKGVTLTQNQFDALVSFCYNVGINAFATSTLLKVIRANPLQWTIRAEFVKWVNVKGKYSEGLHNRRMNEINFYFTKP